GASRYPRWPLRAQPADQGWRGTVEGTEAAPADVRDGDHRALSAAPKIGGGGADRGVVGRGGGGPGRGHPGGILGGAGVALDGFGPQQEELDREAIDAYSRDRFFSGGDNRKSRKVSLMRLNAMSVTILLSLVFLDSASAEGGCGPGFHRTPYGRCRPNEG